MAENKKSFLLYTDLIHTIEKLPNDKAGLLFKHVLRYVNDLNPITDDIIIEIAFEPIKQSLKRDLSKYEEKRNKFSDAGKESAKAKRLSATQLYILKFYNDVEEFIKVGITDNSLNRRYSSSGEGGGKLGYKFDILYQYFEKINMPTVLELENLISDKFKNKKYFPDKQFGGHMECYDKDCYNEMIHFITSFNIVQHRSTNSTVSVNDSVSVNVNDNIINTFPEKPGKVKIDFIDQIIKCFSEQFLKARGVEYFISNKKIERSMAGKLLKAYKQNEKNKGKTSEQTLIELSKFFDNCLLITDTYLNQNMGLPCIVNKLNQIVNILKNGNKQRKNEPATSAEQLTDVFAKHFATDYKEPGSV